jgi:hypothetical protein
MTIQRQSDNVRIPAIYRLVFLFVEPASILLGAGAAFFFPAYYLSLTHAASAPSVLPTSTAIVMTQLSNLYLGLALLEATVLRITSDIKVWSVFLFALLVADLGHLYSVAPAGPSMYWAYSSWNAIDWGNVPFVYFLAIVRICLLMRLGFDNATDKDMATRVKRS